MDAEKIRELLIKYVEDFGTTYSYVAKKSEVGNSHLSMFISGVANFSNDNLDKIVNFLRDRNVEI